MRVLQVITLCELGGAQSIVANIANNICSEHDVVVASGEGDGKMWAMLDKKVTCEHCKYLKRAPSPFNDLMASYELWKLYRKYRPDVIHLHSSKAGILGRLIFPRKKIVYTVHGFDTVRLAHRSFLFLEKLMQHMCRAIVAVSDYDKYNLLAENIKNNVSTIHNGTNVTEIKENLSFNIPNKYKKVVLCIARISPQKNCELFFDIAKLLPEYAFVWIGNQEEVKRHPENVFFLGNLPNAAMYNSIADLFILPTNYEGLPIVIIEAMSFGRPIVASNVGGVSELVQDGVNGYAVENKAEVFADKIKYILENPEVEEKMSENSKTSYKENFTVERMVKQYKDLYKTLV